MKASLPGYNLIAGVLLVVPAMALAQSTSGAPASGPPGAGAVGPQELQNFSLSGRVTKPADQQPTNSAPASTPEDTPLPASSSPVDNSPTRLTRPAVRSRTVEERRGQPASVSRTPPKLAGDPSALATPMASAPAPQPTLVQTPPPASLPSTSALASTQPLEAPRQASLLWWPWLLAAVVLAAGALLLLSRRRHHEAFAGTPRFDAFVAPEPAPSSKPGPALPRALSQPQPAPPSAAPAPPPPAAARRSPAGSGIVSTRLRPSLELGVQPIRCTVDAKGVAIEFELELYNSGTAPARAVLAEASLLNAGAAQEQELAAFFAKPVGVGDRLDAIPPMKRVNFTSKVVAPREAVQEYELGGKKVFVPVLAFNTLYSWSGGEAQTSMAFLVGKEAGGDKIAPFSLDGGPREFANLGVRALPQTFRS